MAPLRLPLYGHSPSNNNAHRRWLKKIQPQQLWLTLTAVSVYQLANFTESLHVRLWVTRKIKYLQKCFKNGLAFYFTLKIFFKMFYARNIHKDIEKHL